MMNSWLNRTSQYPMLSWRAWKITVARRWFISWETKSNCFNLKLCGIEVESTKAQPVKRTANLLLSEGNISVQTEGVMYVKFLRTEMGTGGCQCNGSKASPNTGPGESHHNELQWLRDCQPLGASTVLRLCATPWRVKLLPSIPPCLLPEPGSRPMFTSFVGGREACSQRTLRGNATSMCFVREKILAKEGSSCYWERKIHFSSLFAFHLEPT